MTTETMTIHKSLVELKIIDDRIRSTIQEAIFCVANKHSNEKINGVSVEEFNKIMQGYYDKIVNLIQRRNAIKRAVTLSNAKTIVEISDVEYTVVEAIDMKNHGIEYDELLLSALKVQYKKAQAIILEQNGSELQRRAEQYVIGLYGSREGKNNSDEIEKVKKIFITENTYELVDPIKILIEIEVLEDRIAAFKSEVDAALSVSNAITEITITY